MKKSNDLSADSLKKALKKFSRFLNAYRGFLFFLIVAGLYGFILWRINVLVVATPTDAEMQSAAEQNKTPHVNEAIVKKMQSLKDNSVNVQTLFESARNNPFSE